ncbi:energy-coupling factor transport system substrate-specific component [Terracoccus luteus]|uniref:Energy-coupling factor transport system substrate-specific component n=1 Tax=Terracoccus luteus TaxID=53356 RepID=A0A495Y1E3_9MICO|nr:ECF transporter S component [Terracoccus luteus]RKT77768.1 energy-coupling factor transport system substrate-specific component [Terracoccus luteus]
MSADTGARATVTTAAPTSPVRTVRPRVIGLSWPAVAALALVGLVGAVAFAWPFLASADFVRAHGNDAPWLFAVLLGLLTLVCLAEVSSGRLDAKTIAVLGVAAAAGGAMRLLSAGTAGLEPMFFVVVVAGRVLGPGVGLVSGALAVTTGALLTGGVGPWLPFQMLCAGAIGLGAGLLPVRPAARAERWVLAAYALLTGLLYGAVMNLWFWPFLGAGTAPGLAFVPGAPLTENLSHYGLFYLATSLGWDLPRGVLNAVLVVVAGPALLRVFRRAARRAAFGAPVTFESRADAVDRDVPDVPDVPDVRDAGPRP